MRDIAGGTTRLVSASTNGAVGNGESRSGTMTPDGHYVAFVSTASNLVAGDTNRIPDVFVRDLLVGATALASVGAVSTNASIPMGGSEAPDITPDGRYVAFFSTATNLVRGVPAGGDVYVRDLFDAITVWASVGARPAAQAVFGKTNVVSYNHPLSADGQFIAYETSQAFQPSSTTWNTGLILRYNLVVGSTDLASTNATIQPAAYEDVRSLDMTPDGRFIAFIANTNGNSGETTCVEVWEAQTGTLTLASGDPNGQVTTNSTCDWPTLDSSGRFVTFLSSAVGLVTNSVPGDYHLYQRDLLSGSTTLVDADTNAAGSLVGPETVPAMSADGRFVAFHCPDGNLVADDRNHDSDVFVRDLISRATELVSAHDPGLPSKTPNGNSSISVSSVSGDGRFVAFSSEADNLARGDTNRCRDVFVRDLAYGTNALVSVDTNGFSGDGTSAEPAITPDGRFVAFTSFADDLVAGDTNQAQDVFVRDLQNGVTTLESMSSSGGGPGNGDSFSPLISSDGRYLLFRSRAKNLTSGGLTGENLFLRDRQAGTNYALTTGGVTLAVMTPDGRFVGFVVTNTPGLAGIVYVWNSQVVARTYTNALGSSTEVFCIAMSPDGNRLAFGTSAGLYNAALTAGTNQIIDSAASAYKGLRFSRDGNFLTYSKTTNGSPSQVYLLDVQANASYLVSLGLLSGAPANGDSDSPDINGDGRFVAYRSAATDLVPGVPTNGVPNLFLFDRQTGSNSLLSLNQAGTGFPNNRSLRPVFSGDGRTLSFESWASDLTSMDFNHSSDLFAFTFFYAVLLPGEVPTGGPLLSWPYSSGKNYRVQFKDNLDEAVWQELGGSITNFANRAWLTDPTGPGIHRFYRVVTF